ncbi:MAG: hypothetical protein EA361_10525 [Bacteroidetes bacterium]|nr:MAG: hypothetical protein EA361_10525 [Bacteroidota bacterium]
MVLVFVPAPKEKHVFYGIMVLNGLNRADLICKADFVFLKKDGFSVCVNVSCKRTLVFRACAELFRSVKVQIFF